MSATITVPSSIAFADLHLSRGATGVSFAWEPIEAICLASGIDVSALRDSHEENIADFIAAWYAAHLAAGGERDAVADDLFSEAAMEAARGADSHTPGRA